MIDNSLQINTPDIIEPTHTKRVENATTSGISIHNLSPREDTHDGHCPEPGHEDEDPTGDAKNCYCYPKPSKPDKLANGKPDLSRLGEDDNVGDVLMAACKNFTDYEYGFDNHTSRTSFFVGDNRAVILEYNRDLKEDACKDPRKIARPQCVECFQEATKGW